MAYEETDGSQTSPLGSFGRFGFWYGENGSNGDGALPDVDDGGPGDNQWEASDSINFSTGGSSGGAGNIAGIAYYGNIDIGGVTYPVFQDPISGDFVLFAQSDDALPSSITVGDIQLASGGAVFPFCFMGGTGVGTPAGEALVEDLAIGDRIRTADGRVVTVKWVGRQIVHNPMRAAMDARLAPVCIKAGALGNHSDLYVSADHGMIVHPSSREAVGGQNDGCVINASALVNGDTVRFVPAAELPTEFTYYHIETEGHEVILANGAPSETFIDAAGRAAFDNHQEYLDLYGAERIIREAPLPRITAARLVPQEIKDRLGAQSTDGIAQSA